PQPGGLTPIRELRGSLPPADKPRMAALRVIVAPTGWCSASRFARGTSYRFVQCGSANDCRHGSPAIPRVLEACRWCWDGHVGTRTAPSQSSHAVDSTLGVLPLHSLSNVTSAL